MRIHQSHARIKYRITTIKTGDWVEIDAPKVGQKATVTITRKG